MIKTEEQLNGKFETTLYKNSKKDDTNESLYLNNFVNQKIKTKYFYTDIVPYFIHHLYFCHISSKYKENSNLFSFFIQTEQTDEVEKTDYYIKVFNKDNENLYVVRNINDYNNVVYDYNLLTALEDLEEK